MSHDPARWSSSTGELSPDYEAALAAYRGDGPSDAQLSRMLDGLEGTAPSLLAGWAGWKLGLAGVAAAGAALLGALWLWPMASEPPAQAMPSAANAALAASAPVIESAQAPSVGTAQPPPSSLEPSSETTPAPVAARPAKQARRRMSSLAASPNSAAPAVQDPLAELALLQRARRVLAQQPARALELAEEHGKHYPRGAFSEERELLAIESLVALSLHADAARRGRAFRQQFTRSIHLKRVAELIER